MKISQRSKTSLYIIENVSAPNLPRPARNARRHQQTQGIALVVVLLSAMVLMVSMLAISATMAISSQRVTNDQNVTLQAQYAAEAGLAQVNAQFNQAVALFGKLNVSTTSGSSTTLKNAMKTHAGNYCNKSLNALPSGYEDYRNWSDSHKKDGFILCTVSTTASSTPFSLFTSFVKIESGSVIKYPSGVSTDAQKNDYWSNVFGSGTSSVTVASNSSSQTKYSVTYQLFQPTSVRLMMPNDYRFYFKRFGQNTTSIGQVVASNTVIATRTLRLSDQNSNKEYYVEVNLPSFARNFVFRNQTTSTSGGQLYFAGGETFDGPVHTNGKPGFYKTSSGVPAFTDAFTTCNASGAFSGYSGSTDEPAKLATTDLKNTFKGGAPGFGSDCIAMPDNSYNQLRAAFGGDAENPDNLPCSDLAGSWGLKYNTLTCKTASTGKDSDFNAIPSGVYYSKGSPTTGTNGTPNNATAWTGTPEPDGAGGGIYVKGDVSKLMLSVQKSGANAGKQSIEITQGTAPLTTITRFDEQADGTWKVYVNNSTTAAKTLSGTFNGLVYVDGNINDLRGNGTTTSGVADPDIARDSQLNITTTGKVTIKDDITYTDDPTVDIANNPYDGMAANNVLGIFSSGDECDTLALASCGSVLIDGGPGEDVTINASIMASRPGQGFGATNPFVNLGTLLGRKVRINLTGGIIEDQSQTVGDTGTGGYARAYKYDKRFKDGLVTPPFYPQRLAKWETKLDIFDLPQVWYTAGS